ncbi:hypothetical protein U8527_14940 [Kordia algicida OT-1]|uniref:DinB-like domain-containing protein n=1 Tax=Kordia algicida OT-1 TaxID=391587 RepID=A9DZ11_9FLAO|nr:hypothetical protein [Kordia algicida]EDP96206.1 hypothetical protein KAOT1_08553 [Kordia algicida OT-1]
MNTKLIDSLLNTLFKSKNLLIEINDSSYCCKEVGPYYSSVGSHIRHVLDFYKCIFNGLEKKYVNLVSRERDQRIENDCNCAISEIEAIADKLKALNDIDLNLLLNVEDDLGNGNITLQYTLAALLAQANGHAIHHYAIIGYILDRLDIEIEDENFGYNPTTPKNVLKNTKAS